MLLDEFHERSLHVDMSLGLCRRLRAMAPSTCCRFTAVSNRTYPELKKELKRRYPKLKWR